MHICILLPLLLKFPERNSTSTFVMKMVLKGIQHQIFLLYTLAFAQGKYNILFNFDSSFLLDRFDIFIYFFAIGYTCNKFCVTLVQLQIQPAYIVQNTTGCLNISISENIIKNSSLWIMFNEVFLCNLTNFYNPDQFVDINVNYKGRIQCSVTESCNQASICFTNGIQSSDAGVYDARLYNGTDEFITNNTLYVIGKIHFF